MRVVGLILLILGILGGINSCRKEPPRNASAAYQAGYRAGGVIGTLLFTGVGLWLLLRDGSGSVRSAPLRPRVPARSPPPPPVPLQVPVKIQCGCGQNYSFEVEPIAGRMPAPVSCPVCGADGTEAANAIIAQGLATRAQTSALSHSHSAAAPRRLHPALIVALTVLGMLVLLIAFSVLRRFGSHYRVRQAHGGPPPEWSRPDSSRSRPERPTVPGQAPNTRLGTNRVRSSRAGSASEAALVPPNVTAVEVYWGNRWWLATILKRDGQRAFIHYEGRNSASDEWVTPDRLRPRQ